MRGAFFVLLSCVVFFGGVWVGSKVFPTLSPPVIIHTQDTTEVTIVIKDSTLVDSLKKQLFVVQDSILFYNERIKALLNENPIDFKATDVNEVTLTDNISFTQKTIFDYSKARFEFQYTNIRLTPLSPKDLPWYSYMNIGFLATTDLNAIVLLNYKWATIGYNTNKTFIAGVSFNVWNLINKH